MEFNLPQIIETKRDGKALGESEINFLVKSIAEREINPLQLGAILMAMYLKGLNEQEVVHLTKAMVKHGECLQWPTEWKHLVVDKHSTGGVGDKVSLPLAPALAALGLKVPMISGRGLGFTGGTLDKLESIPGFNVNFTSSKIREAVEKIGCCIVGQTKDIVPADKEMYAARDVTATVSSIPLIVGSIVSKKAAENLSALLLDVKCGQGTFMKNERDARQLAHWLTSTASGLGIKTTAVLTKMDEPIGRAIGNSVEVIESIKCLQGKAPKDLEELICTQGAHLLIAVGKVVTLEQGYSMMQETLTNGSGLQKFQEMLVMQSVSPDVAKKLCDPLSNLHEMLPIAKLRLELKADRDGLVSSINAQAIAKLLTELGAGRLKPTDEVDHGIGMELQTCKGALLKKGEIWAILYHSKTLPPKVVATLNNALTIQPFCNEEQPIESRVIDVVKPKE